MFGVGLLQTADLQTGRLYIVLPLPSLIANLNNLTGVLSLANRRASLAYRSVSLANRSASL